jgi:predicted adenine nucleotide alpha hydrolase (AANH) superfamily ATPase
MKENYDLKMTELMKTFEKGTPLLLHSCCAPCSSACLERLAEVFSVTVLYYNPNIDEREEYEKRKAEQIRFLKETGWAKILDCDYENEAFEAMAKGLEEEPERGKRCYLCYELRLEKTARVAKEKGFEWFCTTLSLSPYKNAEWLNEIGRRVGEEYGVRFLPSDFKKKGGYHRSVALSNEYGLYRQDFCGCRFSKKKGSN